MTIFTPVEILEEILQKNLQKPKNIFFFPDIKDTFDFWTKCRALTKISIFLTYFDFLYKSSIFPKKFYFDKYFSFWPKLLFISQNWNFRSLRNVRLKFRFLAEILSFGRNSDFWMKFRGLAEIPIFGRNSDFAQNLELLRYNCIFSCYYFSTCGNSRTIPKKKFPKTKNILHLSIYFLAAFSD